MGFGNLRSGKKDGQKAAESLEEMRGIAEEEIFELSDDQLDGIAGGEICPPPEHPALSGPPEPDPFIL